MKPQFLVFSCIIFAAFLKPSDAGAAERERKIPEYLRQPLRDLHADCVAETGADEEIMKACLDRVVPDVQEVKCYLDCLMRKSMVYNEEGKVDLRRVRYMVPTDVYAILEEVQKECGHIHEPDGCDTAFKSAQCFLAKHEDTIEFCHLLIFDYKID